MKVLLLLRVFDVFVDNCLVAVISFLVVCCSNHLNTCDGFVVLWWKMVCFETF